MAAYSSPSQSTASGSPLLFDQNGTSYGSAISHTAGSGTFTINQTGLYRADFHGVVSAPSNASFPVSIVTSLTQNGSIVPGASVPHNFQNKTETSPISFSVALTVSTVPTTLQVVPVGNASLNSAFTLTVTRLGNLTP